MVGCASFAPSQSPLPSQPLRSRAALTGAGHYIKHVVLIVQENRSFDNLFAGFPGADAPTHGKIGSQSIALAPRSLADGAIIENEWRDAIAAWDHGKMDRFDEELAYPPSTTVPYSYVPRSESLPLWTIAEQWVLADRMFPTQFGPSFTAHLSLISSNTEIDNGKLDEVDYPTSLPWNCDAAPGTTTFTLTQQRVVEGNGPFPCFSGIRTIADPLDAKGVSWRYYAPPVSSGLAWDVWSEFGAIDSIRYGPDWKNVVTPQTQVLEDIADGALPAMSWVIPDWQDSDHPGSDSTTGPSWVAGVVNAIGESKYWDSTAIVILWDDWGGWYDNVSPPYRDFRGLGIRTPCLIVSPYDRKSASGKPGYVSHTQYEYGSIMAFVEDVFGLGRIGPASMGYTDGRAPSMLDVFDFTQRPRAFKAIPAPYPPSHFLHERPSFKPPDDH